MKTLRFSLLVAMICAAGSAFGQEPKAKAEDKASTAGVSDYFVMVPHTQEQCLQSLDQMKAKGDELLSKFEYGCVSGDHTAYGFIKGSSKESVKKMLPASEQPKAKITMVKKFTAADIEKLHKEPSM